MKLRNAHPRSAPRIISQEEKGDKEVESTANCTQKNKAKIPKRKLGKSFYSKNRFQQVLLTQFEQLRAERARVFAETRAPGGAEGRALRTKVAAPRAAHRRDPGHMGHKALSRDTPPDPGIPPLRQPAALRVLCYPIS